jgi:hypothetical protein
LKHRRIGNLDFRDRVCRRLSLRVDPLNHRRTTRETSEHGTYQRIAFLHVIPPSFSRI